MNIEQRDFKRENNRYIIYCDDCKKTGAFVKHEGRGAFCLPCYVNRNSELKGKITIHERKDK